MLPGSICYTVSPVAGSTSVLLQWSSLILIEAHPPIGLGDGEKLFGKLRRKEMKRGRRKGAMQHLHSDGIRTGKSRLIDEWRLLFALNFKIGLCVAAVEHGSLSSASVK